jgi:hypothetical protein
LCEEIHHQIDDNEGHISKRYENALIHRLLGVDQGVLRFWGCAYAAKASATPIMFNY